MASRVRKATLHPSFPHSEMAEEAEASRNLTWSDEGHEYVALDINLGIEFFTRRSARTNLLSRRLENFLAAHAERAEGATGEEEEYPSKSTGDGAMDQLLRRAVEGALSASGSSLLSRGASGASTSGSFTPINGNLIHRSLVAGTSSPPPSRMSGRSQLRSSSGKRTPSSSLARGNSAKGKERSLTGSVNVTVPTTPLLRPSMAATPTIRLSPPATTSSSFHVQRSGTGVNTSGTGTPLRGMKSGTRTAGGGAAARKSTPRATFAARLCRAERMSPQVAALFDDDGRTRSANGTEWTENKTRTVLSHVSERLARLHASDPVPGDDGEDSSSDDEDDDEQSMAQTQATADNTIHAGQQQSNGPAGPSAPVSHVDRAVAALERVPAPVMWYWQR